MDTKTKKSSTLGERLSDKLADFGGSWTFIICFLTLILIWILINVVWFLDTGFDPYPFILLNLILSCVAALQAPIIMMSQNRLESRDRQRAKNDYEINKKAEQEIKTLHKKVDILMAQQLILLNDLKQKQP
jgi:uncharacterized membrane protein